MTWIIEFVLITLMGVLGGVIGFLFGGGIIKLVLGEGDFSFILSEHLNSVMQEFSVNSDHNLLKFIIVGSVLNAIIGMIGFENVASEDDVDLREENEDWWFETQELELYGHKI